MSYQRRSNCKDCGVSGNETQISKRGLCGACAARRLTDNNASLQAGSGPDHDRWLAAWAAAADRMRAQADSPGTPLEF